MKVFSRNPILFRGRDALLIPISFLDEDIISIQRMFLTELGRQSAKCAF